MVEVRIQYFFNCRPAGWPWWWATNMWQWYGTLERWYEEDVEGWQCSNLKDGRHQVSLKSISFRSVGEQYGEWRGYCQGAAWQRSYSCRKKILQLEERRSSLPSRQMCAPPPLIQSLISARRPDWKSWAIERNKVEFQFRHTMLKEERMAGAVELPKFRGGRRMSKMERPRSQGDGVDKVMGWGVEGGAQMCQWELAIWPNHLTSSPPFLPILPSDLLGMAFFTSRQKTGYPLLSIYPIENKPTRYFKCIDHDFLLLVGKVVVVVVVVRMELISGCCVSMNSKQGKVNRRSRAGLQHWL